MNKQQAKRVKEMVQSILTDTPEMEWAALYAKLYEIEDRAFRSEEHTVILAVIEELSRREREAREATAKLQNDLEALKLDHYFDANCAWENIPSKYTFQSVNAAAMEFHHLCQVVACAAENDDISINKRLGYVIY